MLNKKYFLNSLFFLLCLTFISCSNQTSRTSNVKKVIEERSQTVENTGKAQVTNAITRSRQSYRPFQFIIRFLNRLRQGRLDKRPLGRGRRRHPHRGDRPRVRRVGHHECRPLALLGRRSREHAEGVGKHVTHRRRSSRRRRH